MSANAFHIIEYSMGNVTFSKVTRMRKVFAHATLKLMLHRQRQSFNQQLIACIRAFGDFPYQIQMDFDVYGWNMIRIVDSVGGGEAHSEKIMVNPYVLESLFELAATHRQRFQSCSFWLV